MREARVISLTPLTNGIYALRLAPEKSFSFRAGQYAQLDLGPFGTRPYSLADAPADDGALEIHIKDFARGGASTHAIKTLKAGDKISFSGPYGNCVLDKKDRAAGILAIAGGLGITPLRALIRQALRDNPAREIDLFWGVNKDEDMYLDNEFAALQEKHPGFRFHPVMGTPVGEFAAARQEGKNLKDAVVYLAGPPVMISDTVYLLLTKGAQRERIHFDAHPEAETSKTTAAIA